MQRAAHAIDQSERIGRQCVAAPCNVLVRPRQHQLVTVDIGRIGRVDVQHRQRHTPALGCGDQRRRVDGFIQPQQREFRAERIVERLLLPQPQVRRPASGTVDG